jgi:hypothetical protein
LPIHRRKLRTDEAGYGLAVSIVGICPQNLIQKKLG